MISMKSCNNYDVIKKMPFYVFNNYMTYFNEIKELENKESGSDSTNDTLGNIQQQTKNSLNNIPKLMPKMNNFNFPKK